MPELPDFSTMSKEEIGDWFLNNDTTALLNRAEQPIESMAQVDTRGEAVMKPATFRLPPSMIEWLDHTAGRDREGKSGIVRRALEEYRERHTGNAA
jgi:hypothetical protein